MYLSQALVRVTPQEFGEYPPFMAQREPHGKFSRTCRITPRVVWIEALPLSFPFFCLASWLESSHILCLVIYRRNIEWMWLATGDRTLFNDTQATMHQ